MEALLMKGKPVADVYRENIAASIAAAKESGNKPTLVILLVGDDPASCVYTERLAKLTESLGATAKVVRMPAETTEEEVITLIRKMNRNRYITGILPMMPMPKHINSDAVGAAVTKHKDVDCLNPTNAGELYLGRRSWAPCTARACMAALEHYKIDLKGKHAVVIGRSNVIGKPVALLLLQKHATVTICHSKTENLADITRKADIIIAAVGKAGFVTADMVKEGAVLVDVGINEVDGKLVGDIAPEATAKASAFTPVPGGIGVISNMMVMECLAAYAK
jgi:methylenetetrahydrofolate dehydrogenase (NADP+)/methenyltetrahydrofolate cyclohydrolase